VKLVVWKEGPGPSFRFSKDGSGEGNLAHFHLQLLTKLIFCELLIYFFRVYYHSKLNEMQNRATGISLTGVLAWV